MAKKKSATRRILFIVLGLIVVLVILGVVGRTTGILGNKEEAITVETEEVEIRSITQVVTASGNMQPEVEVNISSDVSGEIILLPVKEGDTVEQGTLLARIKPDFYVAQVEQAEAGVLQSRATLAQRRADRLNAELEMKRQQELFDKQAVSESDYQRAVTQFEVQKASYEASEYAVQSAEARLREARENLSKTSIYAPMSGTISKLDVELGERVVGTSQMTGTEMMRVARLNQMEMEVDVNENDVVNVVVGDTARIEVDAYPDRTFKGIVTEIANSARVTGAGTQEQVTNFPVKIRILDPHNVGMGLTGEGEAMALQEVPVPGTELPNFRPGMSGTVDIFTQTIADAVAVPIQAVTVRDFNKVKQPDEEGEAADSTAAPESSGPQEEDLRRVVFVVVDGKAEMVEVDTGISDDSHIVVKSGLSGGESVVTGPYRVVSRTLNPDDMVEKREGGPVPFERN